MTANNLNPPSFRFPFVLSGHPKEIQDAHQWAFNGITDLQNANAALKNQITDLQTQIAALQKGK